MNSWFRLPWPEVPTVWIDTETTGTHPGIDRAVSIGLVRFERGQAVAEYHSLVNPCFPIPLESTAIHGITDDMVEGESRIEHIVQRPEFKAIVEGCQPGAYNAPFDRWMVPPFTFDRTWPWLDCLSLIRKVDRFEKGQGRHRLANVAARHGVPLAKAHSALDDARAAGEVFYKLAPRVYGPDWWLGNVLHRQAMDEVMEWYRFNKWLSGQPPLPLPEESNSASSEA